MNWFVFGIAAWVVFGLEWGFRGALQLGSAGVAPYFPVALLVFVALWAPVGHAMGAALVIGLVWDLLEHRATASGAYVVVAGPHALGCCLAAYTVVTLRGVMLRKNVLTLMVLGLLCASMVQLVVVVLISVRSWYDVVLFASPVSELWVRLGSALYTGVLCLGAGPVLGVVRPAFAFRPIGGPGFRAP